MKEGIDDSQMNQSDRGRSVVRLWFDASIQFDDEVRTVS